MAKRTLIQLIDDLDGLSPADETVSFSLDGVNYEIDLTADNAAAMREAFAMYVAHGDRVGGRKSTRAASASSSKEDNAAIRTWARGQGLSVSERGRISAEIRDAYAKAHA